MAREKLKHPELSSERLAKLFEHLAQGISSKLSVSKYKRLAGKFRKREPELLAEARKHPEG